MLSASDASVRLLGLDVDPEALARAGARLAAFGDRVHLARSSFRHIGRAAAAQGIDRAGSILLDLGVSSWQLEESGRGFSFQRDAGGRAPAAGPGRPAGRHLVPLGRRSHREAHVPSSRAGGIRRARAVAPAAHGRRGAEQSPRPEREAASAGATPMKKAQRLHHEPDPRVRRALGVALATSALLVAGALTVVGVRLEQVHLAYRLDALRGDRTRAAETIRQLEIEVATLRSPSRLEARARQIGLVAPGRDQVRLAREYVSAGTGLAAERNRAAALAAPGAR